MGGAHELGCASLYVYQNLWAAAGVRDLVVPSTAPALHWSVYAWFICFTLFVAKLVIFPATSSALSPSPASASSPPGAVALGKQDPALSLLADTIQVYADERTHLLAGKTTIASKPVDTEPRSEPVRVAVA